MKKAPLGIAQKVELHSLATGRSPTNYNHASKVTVATVDAIQ